MKIYLLFYFLITISLGVKSYAGQIKIIVSNIDEEKGVIHYGVYKDSNLFPDEEGKFLGGFKEVSKVIKDGLIINNLEESNYAIAIYHDKNSNQKFDTFLAIPTEKYGFSNNAKVFLGPPRFEEASFFVGRDSIVEVMIELR
tara:strand:- start:190 stop:615 length:426 start_codon:yes stop_codon:yes gene_type:complete